MTTTDQLLRFVRAQDLTLRFTLDRLRSVSGWTVKWSLRSRIGQTVHLEKTATLTDSTRGVFSISLAKADTSTLTPSDSLTEGESYYWDLTRTDSGARTVLAAGLLVLDREATP